jgi:ankyrin repeat protein
MADKRLDEMIDAIREGHTASLERLLTEHPDLINQKFDGRSMLHIATDWPGKYPNGAATVSVLIAHGAPVNGRFAGSHSETPLHWAASNNDVEVIDVLVAHGADIEASGGVIAGGTPLADAVAFGQWDSARRLIEHGAAATLWQAAALGLMDRVRECFAANPEPSAAEITNAFWCACHGGQRETAEYLLTRGADLNWIGHDRLTPLDAARRSRAEALVTWLQAQGAKSAR